MILSHPTDRNVRQCIEMTRGLIWDLGISTNVPISECWMQFWHVTRIIEWPWALNWIETGDKVFDVGSDPTFALHLLRDGVGDVTMHHTSVDTENLGQVLVHHHGWVSAALLFKRHDKKLKMVWGYPDQLDIPDATYDVVTNLSVMEHVEPENWKSWMAFCWRILKPGGLLVMSCDYLVTEPKDGPEIDITNHPYWEFFLNPRYFERFGFQHSMRHVPWHPEYEPKQFVDHPNVLILGHPANREGKFTVYGFVVRKST